MVKADRETTSPDEVLTQYSCDYYYPELDCNHQIVLQNHRLHFTNTNRLDAAIRLFGKDYMQSDGERFVKYFKYLHALSMTGLNTEN